MESEPGHGSVFRVYVPLLVEQRPRSPEHVAKASDIERSGMVLPVDDEDMVRDVAAAMLARVGFTVLARGRGRVTVPRR